MIEMKTYLKVDLKIVEELIIKDKITLKLRYFILCQIYEKFNLRTLI